MRVFILVLMGLLLSEVTYTASVPKAISISVLGDYNSSKDFDKNPIELGISLDYAWQIAGLGTDKPHYVSIPIMFNWVPAGVNGEKAHYILRYGWSLRHVLTASPYGLFYINYGLFLNQLWIAGVSGRIMGHETVLGAGYDLTSHANHVIFFQLNGRYANFGVLGDPKSQKYYGIEFSVGMRFLKNKSKTKS